MKHSKLQVFDPPMCCSSGVCGPKVDPDLVRFSADLDWLKKQGVEVERFNLSSHPAAFARQEVVREALTKEGNDCLPLVLVDGAIVSRGTYLSRDELVKFSGIGDSSDNEPPEDSMAASMHDPRDEPATCGPGCACNPASGGKGIKIAISLLVLVAVVGTLVYKASSVKSSASNDPVAAKASLFSVSQAAPKAAPDAARQPSGVMDEKKSVENATSGTQPDAKSSTEAQLAKAAIKIGEYLDSLSDLNKVALSQDAVFIFIPRENNEAVQEPTNTAMLAAQKTLKNSNITLGLYTLSVSSPDYSGISKQVQPPAILVATKGRGMAAVSGNVTESKLLQAFMATSRAGGCGPSSCGPSRSGCK
jgi:hypothetical protein